VLNHLVLEGIKLTIACSFFDVIGLCEIIKLTTARGFSTSPSVSAACTRPPSSRSPHHRQLHRRPSAVNISGQR
jgi:hypothetical protein